MNDISKRVTLQWDCGTAYDLFVSLLVLHQPAKFGLRASWAAGVRSRLPSDARKLLEESQPFIQVPLHWLHMLAEPKDSVTAIWALRSLPASERLLALARKPKTHPLYTASLLKVVEQKAWDEKDVDALRSVNHIKNLPHSDDAIRKALEWWRRPEEFGELYVETLQSYYNVFFQEEELRIRPVLLAGLEKAKEQARKLPVDNLLEELSQGVRFPLFPDMEGIILAPSYWSTPLVVFDWVDPVKQMFLFGARPTNIPLVPGELVPDALVRALKAVADPTRLRILKHLTNEALTPSQLSRLLRLRPPTVIHHLNDLRLAGLVQMTLLVDGERRYKIREEALSLTIVDLERFLRNNIEENE